VIHSFSLVPAAYVFLLREAGPRTEVLLQLRRHTGYMDDHWAAGIAGHVEANESVIQTAIREGREEPDKDDGLAWFALGHLPELVPPHERKVLDALTAGSVPAVMTFGWEPGEHIEQYRVALPH